MKIAFVVHDFTRAVGHGRYTYELARRFAREHEVHVFANGIDREGADGIRFHHVPAVRANALATVATFTVPATLRVGRGWDIIHAQGACCLRFNVITAHICNAGWAEAQRRSRVARTWRQVLFERLVTPLEEATYRLSSRAEVIAISEQLRLELAEHYGRRDPVSVIHHGVDTDIFAPVDQDRRKALRAALAIDENRFVALFVGDMRKGAETVLEIAARTPDIHFMFVSRSSAAPYAARARELGVTSRVEFRTATNAIADYYATADVFLFPSPYDAFGMVISEAMASGLPVVTARTAGASELIVHGRSGFVAESPTDAAAMAEHLSLLASDPALTASMGRAARTVALQHTWDEVARKTMAVYEQAARRR